MSALKTWSVENVQLWLTLSERQQLSGGETVRLEWLDLWLMPYFDE